jgi:hypothetical protein
MRRSLLHRRQHQGITGILLMALAFRALMPVGFMPSVDRPLTLEICRAGFLAPIDLHDPARHPFDSSHFEHCPFGTAPAAGPVSQTPLLLPSWSIVPPSAAIFEPLRYVARLERAHPARGPPRPA